VATHTREDRPVAPGRPSKCLLTSDMTKDSVEAARVQFLARRFRLTAPLAGVIASLHWEAAHV